MPAKGFRKKPEVRKDQYLRIRVSRSQMKHLAKAAKADGMTISEWARRQLMRMADVRLGVFDDD